MTKYSYDEGVIEEGDTIEIHGVEFPLMELSMRSSLALSKLRKNLPNTIGEASEDAQFEMVVEFVAAFIVEARRAEATELLWERVHPKIVAKMASDLGARVSDLDPTQPPGSPARSEPTGSPSTDGAQPEVSTSPT